MSILEERCANFFFSVLYAPRTEGFGLDMRRKCTRDVVWQNEKALPPSLGLSFPRNCWFCGVLHQLRLALFCVQCMRVLRFLIIGGRMLMQWEIGFKVYNRLKGIVCVALLLSCTKEPHR